MSLAQIVTSSFGSLAHALFEAASTGTARARHLGRSRRKRRTMIDPSHWDDRMLRDIGLSPPEVIGPWDRDHDDDPWAILRRS